VYAYSAATGVGADSRTPLEEKASGATGHIFSLIFSVPVRRMVQIMSIPTNVALERKPQIEPRRSLAKLLSTDLDFHQDASNYASHALHAFAAKFPPQLPRVFIEGITRKGETVMDPMMGSGTAIVEAFLCGRRAVGFDIDPLALMICPVKTHPVDLLEATWAGKRVSSCTGRPLQRAVPWFRNGF
jgi:hypothetical protein